MDVNQHHITVDDVPVFFEAGQNLLQACLSNNLDIPYFCWHEALGSAGACRQCAVKLFENDTDTTGLIVMSCMTKIAPGMRISIRDQQVADFRKEVVELVLTNHPHDCPVCEVGGECHLQDMTALTGHTTRRYEYLKRTHLNQDLGPFIKHEMNRCIGCYRCVRFYQDYAGGTDFGVFGSSRNIYFGRAQSGILENEFSGNLTEVCPTGVFVDKPFSTRFQRKWDMRSTPSICQHCAVGCNITLYERGGELRRVNNRKNASLNGDFLCDRGRFGARFTEGAARLYSSSAIGPQGRIKIDYQQAQAALAEIFKQSNVIGIGSARASIESNFALRALVGEEYFYVALSDHQSAVLSVAACLLQTHGQVLAKMQDFAHTDAVIVLGDDPATVAPRMALALRQACRRKITPSSLLVVSSVPTRLDNIATGTLRLRPSEIIEFVRSVSAALETARADSDNEVEATAHTLAGAKSPLIIVGGATCGGAVLQAAADLVRALRDVSVHAKLCILQPDVNSAGLGLIGTKPLSEALKILASGQAENVVILESDLYRHAPREDVDTALKAANSVCVLDHIQTDTTKTVNISMAVGSFAETDGTVVSMEGRAQRYFKAVFKNHPPPASWMALRDAAVAGGILEAGSWADHAGMIGAAANANPVLAGCIGVSPVLLVGAARPATLPHRYSGRTAERAHEDVREQIPLHDFDSAFSATMEGCLPNPGDIKPILWSPGWNSIQATAKLKCDASDVFLFDDSYLMTSNTLERINVTKYQPIQAARLLFTPVMPVFGGEEMSACSSAIVARMQPMRVMLSPKTSECYGLVDGAEIACVIGNVELRRTLVIDPHMLTGIAAIETGGLGEPFVPLPCPGTMVSNCK